MLDVMSPTAQNPAPAEAILHAFGVMDGARLLLIGPSTLDVMCAAIRHGCETVSTARVSDRPEAGSADHVFVSRGASAACVLGGRADNLPARIMRAMVPLASLAIELDPDSGPVAATASRTAQALRTHGLDAIRTLTLQDGRTLLLAERPMMPGALA